MHEASTDVKHQALVYDTWRKVPESDARSVHGCLSGVDNTICMRAYSLYPAMREGYREIFNALLIRLCVVAMFHVQRFEPHTCIVTEGFGALEMRLLLSLSGFGALEMHLLLLSCVQTRLCCYFRYPFPPLSYCSST